MTTAASFDMGSERARRFSDRRAMEGGRASRGTPRLRLRLNPGVHAAGAARRALERLDADLSPQRLEDLRLLVTELVTNAVRHADAPNDAFVELEIAVSADRVRVEVSDAGAGFERRERTAGQDPASGWGLHLVERLSDAWGIGRERGTCVWFEMSRTAPSRPPLRAV